MGEADGRRRWLLAIDTATSQVVVAAGDPAGTLLGASTMAAGYRHGEQLLPAIGRLHGELKLRRSRIAAIVVGTGPGAFTGLRVGIATAKGLAHALGRPIVGISTGEALLDAAREGAREAGGGAQPPVALLVPAGPSDRVLIRPGQAPRLLPGGTDPELAPDELLVAVDLAGRAPDGASERGASALAGFPAALLRLGVARLGGAGAGVGDAPGDAPGDDLARLVPEYVTLPRGVGATTGEVAWSRDHR